jgi:4-diphosphocytidyl-2-C-methyl-D-erythritol kinase
MTESPWPLGCWALRNLPAPAKINLFLHVTGQRADGYHLLETVFQFIELQDTIDLEINLDGSISRSSVLEGVPEDDDITIKAARLLAAKANTALGVKINVTKRIPMGGGLGGGSSDAATVLLGLNRLWSCGLSRDRLAQIGLQLGADVPVFIKGSSAYATGIGENLRPIALPTFPLVLVTPPVNVPTVAIFKRPELTRNTEPITIAGFAKGSVNLVGRNDLEVVASGVFPEVKHALDGLRRIMKKLGLNFNQVRMSGSGGCIFVRGANQSEVQAVAKLAAEQQLGSVLVTNALEQHPLKGSF